MIDDILKREDLFKGRHFDGDAEAKGFLQVVNAAEEVWCIVLKDAESGQLFLFHDYPEYDNAKVMDGGVEYTIPPRTNTLLTGVRFLYLAGTNGSTLAFHNCFTYDKPLIEKIWPKCKIPDEAWLDTFVQSKIQWYDRPQKKGCKSAHGLLNYAKMSGNTHKPEVEDFSVMNAYMLHRCIQDVDIQAYCSKYLQKEAQMCYDKLGIDFTKSYEMEVQYTKTCHEQEVYGALVDQDHIHRCIKDLDEKTTALAEEVEPQLPPTIKANTARTTRSAMMEALGFTKIPPDTTEMVKKEGEMVRQPVKPYYTPSVNFHKVVKTNQYSGFNISYGASPTFVKKNELVAWIKEKHPDTKTADWGIEKEVAEQKVLNKVTCTYFGVEETDTDIICGAHTKITSTPSTMSQHEVTKGFLIRQGIKWAEEWNLRKDQFGNIMKAEYDTEARYPVKAAPENQLVLKIRKGEALVTSPKFGEKEYEQLETGVGKKVGLYNTLVHRRRFFSNPKDPEEKGMLANIREDGRLPCGVNNFGTNTGRSSHRVFVNAPSESAIYGEEVRKSIIASEGKKLVSHDMNSAQLSIAAYYANNYEYFKAVCFGQEKKIDALGNDILHPDTGKPWYIGESGHCTNMQAFGLVSAEEVAEAIKTQDAGLIKSIGLRRKGSKAGTFGTIFGCSGKKLALMLGIPEQEGERAKQKFLNDIGLARPIQILDAMCAKNKRAGNGYIELPFGYHVACRAPHARFNYLD